jgi:hypothetical protein
VSSTAKRNARAQATEIVIKAEGSDPAVLANEAVVMSLGLEGHVASELNKIRLRLVSLEHTVKGQETVIEALKAELKTKDEAKDKAEREAVSAVNREDDFIERLQAENEDLKNELETHRALAASVVDMLDAIDNRRALTNPLSPIRESLRRLGHYVEPHMD